MGIHAWSMMHTACNAPCMLDVYLYIACMLQHVCGMLVRMTLHVWCMFINIASVTHTSIHTICGVYVARMSHSRCMVIAWYSAFTLHVHCMCVACVLHVCGMHVAGGMHVVCMLHVCYRTKHRVDL